MIVAGFDTNFAGSGFLRNDVPESTIKFGMLRSALGSVQTESNACDVSSTRSKGPRVVTTNKRDQEV